MKLLWTGARFTLAGLLAVTIGCGEEGSGTSDDAGPAGPFPRSISISPGFLSLEMFGTGAPISCEGTFSDGSQGAVSAIWYTSDPDIIGIALISGAEVMVTPRRIGSATIGAIVSNDAVIREATMTVIVEPIPVVINPAAVSLVSPGQQQVLEFLGWTSNQWVRIPATWQTFESFLVCAPSEGETTTLTLNYIDLHNLTTEVHAWAVDEPALGAVAIVTTLPPPPPPR